MRTTLAVFEAGRLMRAPLLWAAAALAVAWRAAVTWRVMPNWSLETVHTATATLIVGGAALVAAYLVTTRDRRGGMEMLAALPVRPPARTWAVVVAAPAVAVLSATAATLLQLATLSVGAVPAGRLDLYELCTGIAATALAAALGVALGCWVPHPMAPLVAIFLLAMSMIVGIGGWLVPVVFVWDLPVHLARPSGWHAAYVCALAVLAGAASLLRYGPRLVRVAATVTALAVAIGATLVTTRDGHGPPGPADPRRCERRGDLTYCAFPGYEPWIALWAGAVEPVTNAVPPAARAHLPTIRQRAGTMDVEPPQARTDHSVRPGQMWGRNGGEIAYRRVLAAQFAAALTGLPWGGRESQVGTLTCDARGQARTVVALWLAGHTAAQRPPSDVEIFREPGNRRVGTMGRSDMGWVDYSEAELEYSRRLLARPGARQAVWAHWDRLVDPRTTIQQALPLLGLHPLPAGRSVVPADRMPEEKCP